MTNNIVELESVKSKILYAAAKLFLSIGYEKSTIMKIAEEANVNRGSVIYFFKNKENIVCELVAYVLEGQFDFITEFLKDKTKDKIFFYACETTLQLYIAESCEHLREMYNVAYSMPKSSEIIYQTITKKLEDIFKDYLSSWETKDFYEREISSAGVMRNHMTVPCDMYFTLESKVDRLISTMLKIYDVDSEIVEETKEFVKKIDFEAVSKKAVEDVFEELSIRPSK